MSRAWKPGDLAAVECSDGEWRQAICDENLHGLIWKFPDATYRLVLDSVARRLVVIDPADSKQVERLETLYLSDEHDGCDDTTGCLQTALYEFASPRPPEPTGDGAVVEDAVGYRWVRIAHQGRSLESPPWRHRGHSARWWQQVNVVRVLSEGVPPVTEPLADWERDLLRGQS